jgi:hypothetical protein
MQTRQEPEWHILQLVPATPGWQAIYRHSVHHSWRVRAIVCWALVAEGGDPTGQNTFVVGLVSPGKGAGALQRADLYAGNWQLVCYWRQTQHGGGGWRRKIHGQSPGRRWVAFPPAPLSRDNRRRQR